MKSFGGLHLAPRASSLTHITYNRNKLSVTTDHLSWGHSSTKKIPAAELSYTLHNFLNSFPQTQTTQNMASTATLAWPFLLVATLKFLGQNCDSRGE